jgi:hypothetical protein
MRLEKAAAEHGLAGTEHTPQRRWPDACKPICREPSSGCKVVVDRALTDEGADALDVIGQRDELAVETGCVCEVARAAVVQESGLPMSRAISARAARRFSSGG